MFIFMSILSGFLDQLLTFRLKIHVSIRPADLFDRADPQRADRFFGVVEVLVDAGAQPDVVGYRGFAALHLAALTGSAGACAFLLGHGSDPELRGAVGRTPLHCACLSASPRTAGDVTELLVEIGARPELEDDLGYSAIDLARRHGRYDQMRRLELGCSWRTAARTDQEPVLGSKLPYGATGWRRPQRYSGLSTIS